MFVRLRESQIKVKPETWPSEQMKFFRLNTRLVFYTGGIWLDNTNKVAAQHMALLESGSDLSAFSSSVDLRWSLMPEDCNVLELIF